VVIKLESTAKDLGSYFSSSFEDLLSILDHYQCKGPSAVIDSSKLRDCIEKFRLERAKITGPIVERKVIELSSGKKEEEPVA